MSRACDRERCPSVGLHPVDVQIEGERRPVPLWLCTEHRAEAHRLGRLVDRLTRRPIPPDQPIPGALRPPAAPPDLPTDDDGAPDEGEPDITPPDEPEETMHSRPPPPPYDTWLDAVEADVHDHPRTTSGEVERRTGCVSASALLKRLVDLGRLQRVQVSLRPPRWSYWVPVREDAAAQVEVASEATLAEEPPEGDDRPTAGSMGEDEEIPDQAGDPTTDAPPLVGAALLTLAAVERELREIEEEKTRLEARLEALSQRRTACRRGEDGLRHLLDVLGVDLVA